MAINLVYSAHPVTTKERKHVDTQETHGTSSKQDHVVQALVLIGEGLALLQEVFDQYGGNKPLISDATFQKLENGIKYVIDVISKNVDNNPDLDDNAKDIAAVLVLLLNVMAKLYSSLRDAYRKMSQVLVTKEFEALKTSYDTKLESVHETFSSQMDSAIGLIVSGAVQGAFAAGGAGVGNVAVSEIGRVGMVGESVANMTSADKAQTAGEDQVGSDMEKQISEMISRSESDNSSKGSDSSAQFRSVIQDITQAYAELVKATVQWR